MKINRILAALALSAGFLAVSCEDSPTAFVPADGVPTVHYVRYADQDIMIEQAYMEETICIVGDNLRSVNQLWFNDQQAVLNTSFMTANTIIVGVPKEMAKEQTDKMYLITAAKDTVTYDFKVLAPAPVIKSMNCEMLKPGEVATIYGDYFTEPLTLEFPNAEVTDFKSIEKTAITFTIPEGALAGKIKVTTASGTGQSPFQYNSQDGLLFDFDTYTNTGQNWHALPIIADGPWGSYVRFGDGSTTLEDATWGDSCYAFEYWCGSWDTPQKVAEGSGQALHYRVDFTNYDKMALKFEMMIPSENPWSACAMQIAFEGYDKVTISGNPIDGFEGTPAGANAWVFNGDEMDLGNWGRAMYRPWEATGSYHTDGKWITVTIPLSEMTYNKDGGPATFGPNKPEDFASLTMFIVGGGVGGTACTPIIYVDNIRAVQIK